MFGSFWGRTKVFPKLSPGKTWEGYIGGLVVTLALGVAINAVVFEMDIKALLLMGGIVLLSGVVGDQLMSMIKRKRGVKDFPPIHHLHGGVLDIYDSFLFAALVFALIYESGVGAAV